LQSSRPVSCPAPSRNLHRTRCKMSPIQKHRRLQFHVEAYLHETYLLEQRLLKFLKVLEREHRRDPEIKAIKELCAALGEFVRGAFKRWRSSAVAMSMRLG
jgi:hypothetical protein